MRLLFLLLAGSFALPAHDLITTKLTWSREVSRIVLKHCASCHRDGGSAPMSLLTWEEARPWAKSIKEEVLERRMPPWGAVKGFGDFQNDYGLTQEEITILAEWVEGGAPAGDSQYLPGGSPTPLPKAPARPVSLTLRDHMTLTSAIHLTALQPQSTVAQARIIAARPDGTEEPLLWLKNYNQKFRHKFVFRDPVQLPKGTVIHITPPVPLTAYR